MSYIPTVWKSGDIVSSEKLNKLEQGVADATSESIIVEETDAWLEENIAQETGYALDSSLTMSNAAAPADKVGELKTAITQLDELTLTYDTSYTEESISGWTLGYVTLDGVIHTSSSLYYVEKIPCKEGCLYTRGWN